MYLNPKLNEIEAIGLLTKKKQFFWEKYFPRKEDFVRTELIYLPYYLFVADMHGNEIKFKKILSVDAMDGYAAFFYSDENDINPDCDETTCHEFNIAEDTALKIAKEYCRGYFLEQGLRVRKHATLDGIVFLKKVYFPFWIGYFRKSGKYDFKAIDAISGASQGIRMRKVFLKALRFLKAQPSGIN